MHGISKIFSQFERGNFGKHIVQVIKTTYKHILIRFLNEQKCRTIKMPDYLTVGPSIRTLSNLSEANSVVAMKQQYFSDGFVEIQWRRQHISKTETNLNRKIGNKRNFVEGKQRTKEIEIDKDVVCVEGGGQI